MERVTLSFLALLLCVPVLADETHARPRILGVASVQFYSTDVEAARSFYSKILGDQGTPSDACLWCERNPFGPGSERPLISRPLAMGLNSGQYVALSKSPQIPSSNLLHEIVFGTDNVRALKKYLLSREVSVENNSSDTYFALIDPEGHRIGFTQAPQFATPAASVKMQIIHAGFVVKDRAAEDRDRQ